MKASSPEVISTKYRYQIIWKRNALEQARYLVAKCTAMECQWFHMIDRDIDHKAKTIKYYISDMLIPEQTVSGQTVETDGNMLLKLAFELRERHGLMVRDPEGKLSAPVDERGQRIPPTEEAVQSFNDDCARMAVWCHSHVQMACNPSGTDNEQWKDWIERKITDENPSQPVMMVIFNQKDEYFCRLYDPVLGAEVQNATFHISDGFDFSNLDLLIKDRIKQKVWTNNSSTSFQGKSTGGSTANSGNFHQGSNSSQYGGNISIQKSQDSYSSKNIFPISCLAASYDALINLSKAICEPSTQEKLNDNAKEMANHLDQYFTDDQLEAGYHWHIMNELLWPSDASINPISLYDFVLTNKNKFTFKEAREIFIEKTISTDVWGPDLFIAAAEISFGFKLKTRLPYMAAEFDRCWAKLEDNAMTFYTARKKIEEKEKQKNEKSSNKSSSR
jgi:hypothetical protein